MSQPPTTGKPPACFANNTAQVPVPSLGGSFTAQDLLNLANSLILNNTKEPMNYPICGCNPAYPVARNAFLGDAVCVTESEQMQAASDYKNALAMGSASTYSTSYTAPPVSPYTVQIPYGICRPEIITSVEQVYRQAYMGDYVCVSLSQWAQVAADNAAFPTRVQFCPGAPLPPQFPPLPVLPGLPLPGFPLPGPPGPLLGPGD
jgi:hypothetical protein